MGILVCGLIVAKEGFGLAVDWRRGATAFVAKLREDKGNPLVSNYPSWGVRVGGAIIALIGWLLVGDGVLHVVR